MVVKSGEVLAHIGPCPMHFCDWSQTSACFSVAHAVRQREIVEVCKYVHRAVDIPTRTTSPCWLPPRLQALITSPSRESIFLQTLFVPCSRSRHDVSRHQFVWKRNLPPWTRLIHCIRSSNTSNFIPIDLGLPRCDCILQINGRKKVLR